MIYQTAALSSRSPLSQHLHPEDIKSKIVIDNKIIEQVNSFNYLGNMIKNKKELHIDNKLHNYLKITGILNNVFRPQNTLKKTRIKTIH
jgi:hypothetical protein